MDPIVLPAAAVTVFLLTGRTKQSGKDAAGNTIPKNPGGTDKKTGYYNPVTPNVAHTDDAKAKATENVSNVINAAGGALRKVPVLGQVAQVLTAQAYGSYLLTKEITGSETAGLAAIVPGALNIANGVAVGAGVKGGELFSSAAGGSTDQFNRTSDALAQASGGGIVAGAIYISAYVAASVIAPLALIGYGIASLFEDAARLGYGQPGINSRLQSLVTEIEQRVIVALGPDHSAEELPYLELAGRKLGEAYAKMYNEILFNAWMKRNKGLTVSWQYHGVFGRDRGYFSGNVSGNGDTAESIRLVPTFTQDFGNLPPEFAGNAGFQFATNIFRAQANAYLYAHHMQKDARALGIGDGGHARAGISEGQYYGVIHNNFKTTPEYSAAKKAAIAALYGEAIANNPALTNSLQVPTFNVTLKLNGQEMLLTPDPNEDIGYLEYPYGYYWDWRTIAVKESEG